MMTNINTTGRYRACGGDDEVCGIYQSAYEGVAPGAKFPEDECPVVLGMCGHCFHLQCVTAWLSTRSTSPMCRSNWEFGAFKALLLTELPVKSNMNMLRTRFIHKILPSS